MFQTVVAVLLFFYLSALHSVAIGSTLKGEIETRFDYYTKEKLFTQQSDRQAQLSVGASLDYNYQINRDIETNISVFARYNPEANKRSQGDIREFKLSYYQPQYEVSAGVLMERWGVLEAYNPLEVINPRDRAEDFQGTVKLGIPGGKFSYLLQSGKVDVWLLPYSREARLSEARDRFRTVPFALSDAQFEGGKNTLSSAIRFSQMLESVEFAISYYNGHARSPSFTPNLDGIGNVISLQPNYARIVQTGFEMLWINGQWLTKLESVYHSSYNASTDEEFLGLGVGLEREFPSLASGKNSLTAYSEYYYDDRDINNNLPITPFQNDIFLGLRLARNNLNSTEYQIRFTHDLDYNSSLWDLRVKTRLKKKWFIETSLYKFVHTENDPALKSFASDSRIAVNAIFWF